LKILGTSPIYDFHGFPIINPAEHEPLQQIGPIFEDLPGSVEFEAKNPQRTNNPSSSFFDLHLQPLKRRIVMCTASIQQWLVG
jgi:hypothetical protein